MSEDHNSTSTDVLAVEGFLGIDIGTQGLSVVLLCPSAAAASGAPNTGDDSTATTPRIIKGESTYGFVPDLPEGHYEQTTQQWESALREAMGQVHQQLLAASASNNDTKSTRDQHSPLSVELSVLAIGVSGQMHGEVLLGGGAAVADDDHHHALAPVRLWCDARNEAEARDMMQAMGPNKTKIPKRNTAARFLWTARHRPALASQTQHITTPAGWCAARLNGGHHYLGIGDASGIFPIDPNTNDYDASKLDIYDTLIRQAFLSDGDEGTGTTTHRPFKTMLPRIRRAGQDAGYLSNSGAELLGIPLSVKRKIPIAPAEGDQICATAASLIGRPGRIAMSFGTSVVANVVATGPCRVVTPAIDNVCDAAGNWIHMVCLRNGTTFLNTMVESYGQMLLQQNQKIDGEAAPITKSPFEIIMPLMLEAPPDCRGLLALPFQDDEPAMEVAQGGTAMIIGLSSQTGSHKPGCVAKAALLSTLFNLKLGCLQVGESSGPTDATSSPMIVLTGGLTKSPGCGQIVADVFNMEVCLPTSGSDSSAAADEGSCWGATLLAKYRYETMQQQQTNKDATNNSSKDAMIIEWPTFLDRIAQHQLEKGHRFRPIPANVGAYEQVLARYKKLLDLQPHLQQLMMRSS